METIEADTIQLAKLIRYHEGQLHNAKLLGAISSVALEELTIKYLMELKTIKERVEK